MRIAVNTRLLIKDRLEGIGWFTYETLRRITRQHPEHEFIFIFDRPYTQDSIFSDNVIPVVIGPKARHAFLFVIWFEISVKKILKKYKADIFISPDGYLSLRSKIPSLQVIHDINFEHYPEFIPFWARKHYKYFFPRYAAKAERIATVSEFSKKDIVETYKVTSDKIDVTYNGANENYIPLSLIEKTEIRNKFSSSCEYFLFVGSLHPRKNLKNLINAFGIFKEKNKSDIKLLIVGDKYWGNKEMQETYEKNSVKNEIIFTGRLNNDELKSVYGAALALCYVSIFEGFGIPIVEAMYCDVPVITSNTSSMPEVGGDAVLFADPFSVDSIENALEEIYSKPELRKELIEKGRVQRQKFSWQKTSDNLWKSISVLIDKYSL
ncbi:MAG: glycosyltransferase family 1 protein [Bacteroidota bacterium]